MKDTLGYDDFDKYYQLRQDFPVLPKDLIDFITLSDTQLTLGQNFDEELLLFFTASETQEPGIYSGKITFSNEIKTKELIIIIEVKSRFALFDIILEVPKTEYILGETIKGNANLTNFGDLYPLDVTLYYALREIEGIDLQSKKLTFAVEQQKSVPIELVIPKSIANRYGLSTPSHVVIEAVNDGILIRKLEI